MIVHSYFVIVNRLRRHFDQHVMPGILVSSLNQIVGAECAVSTVIDIVFYTSDSLYAC